MTSKPKPRDAEEEQCAAQGHKYGTRRSRTVSIGAFETARVYYCDCCGMEFGKYAGRQS